MNTDEPGRQHHVEARRSGGWWAITVPEQPGVFSQARRLDQVEAMARDAIAVARGIDPEDVAPIVIEVVPPDSVKGMLDELKASLDAAESATAHAVATRRRVARMLHDMGMPMRDVGVLIGMSHQRVSQILSPPRSGGDVGGADRGGTGRTGA